jgi:rhodanese-related sulfurtransferase
MRTVLACALLAVAASAAAAPDAGFSSLTPAELQARLSKKDLRVVDVRSAEEFSRERIPGAVNVAWKNDARAFIQELGGDKSQAVGFYCNGPT